MLAIPDITDDDDNLGAALKYAQNGWYILPVRIDPKRPKRPGSVVGDDWPSKSSRDPKQITAWFAATDHGIALHCGRSGAITLDVDNPDNIPDEVVAATETTGCPYQSTRPDEPGRGHYLFANTTGRRIGNGLGRLATTPKWGEVRGANGVIIAAPSVHFEGHYHWERTGPLPPIPDYLADTLPESSTPEDTATDVEIEAFFERHTEATKLETLSGLVNTLRNKLAAGHSCHMSTLGILTDAMQEAAAGYYDARTATRELYPLYLATVTTGTSTGRVLTRPEARAQYAGIVAWAIGQAEANTGKARERINQKYQESVVEIDPQEIGPPPAPTPLETLEAGFWSARQSLKLVYDAALSQMCSPWAVLACAAARLLTLVPPTVTLPPVIGGPGTLNWFAAIVAKSGGGKGAANAVAAQLVPGDILVRGSGSGEGMIEAYDRKNAPQDHIVAVLFSVDEVDSLTSLQARSGQTTMSVIRSGFSGETLGYSYRHRSKEKVDAHTYRMTMIVSVQPERAEGLFDHAGGGTPQRFMWFPGRDKRIKACTESWSTDHSGFHTTLPPINFQELVHGNVQIPVEAEQLIRQTREASMSGDDNALDGHALYCREKFAYAITLLDGRTVMNNDDWELSGIAAAVSDWCRRRAQDGMEQARHSAAAARGKLRGIENYESEISKAVASHAELKRTLIWAVRKLTEAGGRMTKGDLNRAAASRDRARLAAAMLAGVDAGLVKADGSEWVLL